MSSNSTIENELISDSGNIAPVQPNIEDVNNETIENNDERDSDGHGEGEEITAQKVLEYLETAWCNELSAPDILQHQSDMIDLMMSQVQHMEDNMKNLDKSDLRFTVHQMELERIRYVITSYIRCRLKKIELFARYVLNEDSKRDPDDKRLSNEETQFAQEYIDIVEGHFQQVALQYMPTMQRSDIEQRTIRPNLMSHVFIKANVSVPSVVVGVEDEEVDMAMGSQHILPYQLIADMVHKNLVKLI